MEIGLLQSKITKLESELQGVISQRNDFKWKLDKWNWDNVEKDKITADLIDSQAKEINDLKTKNWK